MWKLVLILGYLLHSQTAQSLWQCISDAECSSAAGSVCSGGQCVCLAGQQLVLGGTLCADVSPYMASPCVEDHQCYRLGTSFECRKTGEDQEGYCYCQNGFHYLYGRCWRTIDYEQPCNRDEECLGSLPDPFSLKCEGVCVCADGYYLRQRGECRKIGYGVGSGCVLDEDCQFSNGVCDIPSFTCYDSTVGIPEQTRVNNLSTNNTRTLTKQLGVSCDLNNPCADPHVCEQGVCVCPMGYYESNNAGDNICLANLGSPSTVEQCRGFLAEVRDGICTCPVNFYFEENMRDCIKVTRRPTDACANDDMCLTFGAASRCAEPVLPWFFQQCECSEQAVWDEGRQMCRLFVGIGEECESNSDCLAGEMEIICSISGNGQGVCVCPDGFVEVNGLCLTSGLQLGDPCQATSECTVTEHTVCDAGTCSCGQGYQEADGYCAPTLGGSCLVKEDCVIENSECVSEDEDLEEEDLSPHMCQCGGGFVEANDLCWPTLPAPGVILDLACEVAAQCQLLLGHASACVNEKCECYSNYHYRDGGCWPQVGLFETCSRTSECFLGELTDRVLCRNSICQCDFEHPFSEDLNICGLPSSATVLSSSISTLMISLYYLMSN